MKFYIELTLLPSVEINPNFLWSKIYPLIHLALVEIQEADGSVPVGVAFPEYEMRKSRLGCKLRLFALEEVVLEKLNLSQRFHRFSDYVHWTGIRPVPNGVQSYAFYHRQQPNRSPSKLNRTIKRKAAREGVSLAEAEKQLAIQLENKARPHNNVLAINATPLLEVPYLQMKSLSSGKKFYLFIGKEVAREHCSHGFGSYGLSHRSSVPDF